MTKRLKAVEYKCCTCGQSVEVHHGKDGTNSYIPVCEQRLEEAVKVIEFYGASLGVKIFVDDGGIKARDFLAKLKGEK